ncbi:Ornithine carbamoyltransferase [Giardia muris]|uniref:ornithine carbamoyltransferase n=1 Tax=Giardia muris TaxID=5742 RepID=A0A4Z1SRA7_GIAMU|nr:Ornithine carbamoyltransferase [Giardia muris]|eukprot:TNJ28422.1 Ornithine carbamoyltransferase [Giardia muris]
MPARHLLTISDLTPTELKYLIDRALLMKARPEDYAERAQRKTLLAIFSKPSLRTRVSLETAMTRMGGHAIYYEIGSHSNVGGKETVQDTAEVFSRMVDICSARLHTREMMSELAKHSLVPCLNALDDWAHPLQMVCDFMTIQEHFGGFQGVSLAYCGDSRNNVTYDLMRACSLLGIECRVCCPNHPDFKPCTEVVDECANLVKKYSTGAVIRVYHDCLEGVKGVDVVYTDSWMSYHIPEAEREERRRILLPYQVTDAVMAATSSRSVFMNCLPASRGDEQTASVMDGAKSICYTQAGNRLPSAMAVLDFFLHGCQMS